MDEDDLAVLCEPVIAECDARMPLWLKVILFLWLFD